MAARPNICAPFTRSPGFGLLLLLISTVGAADVYRQCQLLDGAAQTCSDRQDDTVGVSSPGAPANSSDGDHPISSDGAIGMSEPDQPRYLLPLPPGRSAEILAPVEVAFQELGYTKTSNHSEARVIWSWLAPFTDDEEAHDSWEALAHLRTNQWINQVPASGVITIKSALMRMSNTFDFIPRSFILPRQYDAFQEFVATDKGAQLEWIRKSAFEHRGVEPVQPSDPRLASEPTFDDPILVQQLIRPYLIGRRLWDLGVYVAITSLSPLRAYMYEEAPLWRFCKIEYDRNMSKPASYVIAPENLMFPISISEVRPHLQAAMKQQPGRHHPQFDALRAILKSRGEDVNAWWCALRANTAKLLVAAAEDMAEEREASFPGLPFNFFTMLRFDWLYDENLQPFLMEVNMSPSLLESNHTRLFKAHTELVRSLLTLNGFGPGGIRHPHTASRQTQHWQAAEQWAECAGRCKQTCADEGCHICPSCMSDAQKEMVNQLVAEQYSKKGWTNIIPAPQDMLACTDGLWSDGRHDRLMQDWMERQCGTWC